MELLFAIFIFAIVISSVYGSYRATFHTVHNAEAQVKVAHDGRVALVRITDDLQSLTIGTNGYLLGESQEYGGERGDSLSFVSSKHIALRKQDALVGDALIQYTTGADDQSDLLNIYRSDTVIVPGVDIGEEDVQKHLLCSGVLGISFTYIDGDGNEAEEWLSSESPGSEEDAKEEPVNLPHLIYVEVKFADSTEGDNLSVFRTAVAIPGRPNK